jgi:glutathione S-transferase
MALIKLWYVPGGCSLAPHILLNEAGLQFKSVQLDIFAGYPEEFRQINPKMRVPVLSIDGEIITEVPAIMTAISQLVPEKHLLGKTNLEIVRAYEWMNWVSGVLHGQAFGGVLRSTRYSDDPTAYASIKAKGLLTVQGCYATIDEKLSSEHVVGSSFTAVDAYLYTCYRWGASLGLDMEEKYPNYTGLVVNLIKRQAVHVTLKDEGIEAVPSASPLA